MLVTLPAQANQVAANEHTDLIPSGYILIASATQVPPELLYAIATQESALKINQNLHRPWPWTLNIAGKGYYYDDYESACRALTIALHVHDAKRVDVGIAQINIGWNPELFLDPCYALEPYQNLKAAGQILRKHYEKSGNWITAAGLYHHPAGGSNAEKYRLSVAKRIEKLNTTHRGGL